MVAAFEAEFFLGLFNHESDLKFNEWELNEVDQS
jgi:hypothetical protein